MSTKKGSKEDKKKFDRIAKFVFYSIAYAVFMGIIYGTVQQNLGTVQIFGFVWISWEQMFVILGIAGWAVLSWYIWKGKITYRGFET